MAARENRPKGESRKSIHLQEVMQERPPDGKTRQLLEGEDMSSVNMLLSQILQQSVTANNRGTRKK